MNSARPSRVYRLYSSDDRLLYVGATVSLQQRLRDHGRDKEWWPEVARTEVSEPYESWGLAHAAEIEAIRTEQPVYNVVRYPTSWEPTAPEWDEDRWQEGKARFEALPEEIRQLTAEYMALSVRQFAANIANHGPASLRR